MGPVLPRVRAPRARTGQRLVPRRPVLAAFAADLHGLPLDAAAARQGGHGVSEPIDRGGARGGVGRSPPEARAEHPPDGLGLERLLREVGTGRFHEAGHVPQALDRGPSELAGRAPRAARTPIARHPRGHRPGARPQGPGPPGPRARGPGCRRHGPGAPRVASGRSGGRRQGPVPRGAALVPAGLCKHQALLQVVAAGASDVHRGVGTAVLH
mmetsp:Transcript_16331/g.57035  ORF Transcript_16331/g.57035 Transcript_16331/m.57035 type:complete len:212 (+) Transcript_16331:191-826(+)